MRKLDFISASTAITGYCDSQLAKSETNDCAVRAIASAYGMTYDRAHDWVRNRFNRKHRKGTYGFIFGLDMMSNTGEKLNRKGIKKLPTTIVTKTGTRTMTVNNFSQNYDKGTYIITVKGHTFTLKDGKVIGNFEDARKIRRKITGAWKIGK